MPPSTRSQRPPLSIVSDVTVVIDRSGSMHTVESAIYEGTAELLLKHAKAANVARDSNYSLRVVSFDDKATVLYSGAARDLLDASGDCLDSQKYEAIRAGLAPRGRTRLIDTLVHECIEQAKRVDHTYSQLSKATKELAPEMGVVLALLTDGINNCGSEDPAVAREVVEKHRGLTKATCQFIASNQLASSTGPMYGFDPALCLQMDADPAHTRAAMTCIADSALRTLTGEIADFSQVERTMSSGIGIHDEPSVNPFFPTHQHLARVPPSRPPPRLEEVMPQRM